MNRDEHNDTYNTKKELSDHDLGWVWLSWACGEDERNTFSHIELEWESYNKSSVANKPLNAWRGMQGKVRQRKVR